MATNSRWSDDEFIVLLAFYFRYPRSSHTDSHPDCQKLARTLGRTPGAIDNQLRNIDFDLVHQTSDRHCSQRLAQLLDQYKDNLPTLYQAANAILQRNGWRFSRF